MIKNKALIPGMALLLGPLALQQAQANDSLARYFPEDSSLYIEVPDGEQFQEDWKQGPLYELYEREDVQEFVQAMIAKAMDEASMDDLGEDSEDQALFQQLFKEQFAVGIQLKSLAADILSGNVENEDFAPDVLAVFAIDDDDFYEKLLEKTKEEEGDTREVGDFLVVNVDENVFVCLNPEVVALCSRESQMDAFLDRYQNSGTSLLDNGMYQEAEDRVFQQSEINCFLDLSILDSTLRELIPMLPPNFTAQVQAGSIAPPEAILDALGLNAFQMLAFSWDLDPDELRSRNIITMEPNDGLFGSLLEYYGKDMPDESVFTNNLHQAVAANFDLSAFLHKLEATIQAVSPMGFGMYQMYKSNLEQQLGISFSEAIIDNFDANMYVFGGVEENTSISPEFAEQMGEMADMMNQGQTMALGIKNRTALENLIDRLNEAYMGGSLTKEDYLGTTLYSMQSPMPMPTPTFAVNDRFFIFDQKNADFLRSIVAGIANPGERLTDRDDVSDALDDLPSNPTSFNYADLGGLLQMYSSMFSKLLGNPGFMGAMEEEGEDMSDFPAIPVIKDFNYIQVSTSYLEDNSIYTEGVIRKKSE